MHRQQNHCDKYEGIHFKTQFSYWSNNYKLNAHFDSFFLIITLVMVNMQNNICV